MYMKRTTIFLNPDHMRRLAVIGKATGLKPAHLVRVAILQYIRRESGKQASQVVLPGRKSRGAAFLGEQAAQNCLSSTGVPLTQQ
jgi:hypothetical protein